MGRRKAHITEFRPYFNVLPKTLRQEWASEVIYGRTNTGRKAYF
jgi:hypothetical protein